MIVKIDSREQNPLGFKIGGNISKVTTVGLPFGDYWCELESGQEIPWVFERKNVQDLLSTMTSGNERFHREVDRAKKVDCKLEVIIEAPLSTVIEEELARAVKPGTIIKSIFTFKVKHGIEPIFCSSREEMMRYMIETWEAFGRNFKHIQPLNTVGLDKSEGTFNKSYDKRA